MKRHVLPFCVAAFFVAGFVLGGFWSSRIFDLQIVDRLDLEFDEAANNFFPEPDYSIAKDYPAMSESDRDAFLKKNSEFYKAVENGEVMISPLSIGFFFSDSAGNNPAVLKCIGDYNGGDMAFDEFGRCIFKGDRIDMYKTFEELALAHYKSSMENAKENIKFGFLRFRMTGR
ncbi:MAG: hypothetical protein LBU32_23120 [Clostridiales bacterium]|jgi:hypothetical protein|nr:hypothetical protein [Clostridiales bacterium]